MVENSRAAASESDILMRVSRDEDDDDTASDAARAGMVA
jgi:hypothetical protein